MVREEQMLVAALPLQPEVDRAGRDRRGQRPEVFRRRTSDRGELLEAPVGQGGVAPGRVVQHERVVGNRLGPERRGFDGALLETVAPSASRRVERRDAVEPLIGRARGPFAMRGIRGDSGHTTPVHGVLLFDMALRAMDGNEAPRRATWRGGQDGRRTMQANVITRPSLVKSQNTLFAPVAAKSVGISMQAYGYTNRKRSPFGSCRAPASVAVMGRLDATPPAAHGPLLLCRPQVKLPSGQFHNQEASAEERLALAIYRRNMALFVWGTGSAKAASEYGVLATPRGSIPDKDRVRSQQT